MTSMSASSDYQSYRSDGDDVTACDTSPVPSSGTVVPETRSGTHSESAKPVLLFSTVTPGLYAEVMHDTVEGKETKNGYDHPAAFVPVVKLSWSNTTMTEPSYELSGHIWPCAIYVRDKLSGSSMRFNQARYWDASEQERKSILREHEEYELARMEELLSSTRSKFATFMTTFDVRTVKYDEWKSAFPTYCAPQEPNRVRDLTLQSDQGLSEYFVYLWEDPHMGGPYLEIDHRPRPEPTPRCRVGLFPLLSS